MKAYDPLDAVNIATHIAEKLLAGPLCPLPPDDFSGDGVYAVYYMGRSRLYAPISGASGRNNMPPIYVGKAQPGGRKGGIVADEESRQLLERLKDHAESIAATDLDAKDFRCRFLVLTPVWIPIAERLLIMRFQPVWNIVVDGFGNHDPGKKRHGGRRPDWDTLHPGRWWSKNMTSERSRDEIAQRIEEHFSEAARPP